MFREQQQQLREVQLFRQAISHVVTTLASFVQAQLLDVAWTRYQERVRTEVVDLHDLRQASGLCLELSGFLFVCLVLVWFLCSFGLSIFEKENGLEIGEWQVHAMPWVLAIGSRCGQKWWTCGREENLGRLLLVMFLSVETLLCAVSNVCFVGSFPHGSGTRSGSLSGPKCAPPAPDKGRPISSYWRCPCWSVVLVSFAEFSVLLGGPSPSTNRSGGPAKPAAGKGSV